MAAKNKISMSGLIRNYFVTGIFTVLPLAGTWLVVTALVRFLWKNSKYVVYEVPLGILQTVLPEALQRWADFLATAIGLSTIFAITIVIGLLARWFVGKTLIGWMEKILANIPVVSWVYNVIRQIISTFNPQQGKVKNFRKALLVPFGQGGNSYAMAFLTNEINLKVKGKKEPYYICYLACNQMIQGYNIFVKKKDCIELDMPVDQAIQQVVSLGLVSPREMEALTAPRRAKKKR